jgi:hypothetical protein
MKKLIIPIIFIASLAVTGYLYFKTPEKVVGFYTPPVSATSTMEFGYGAYTTPEDTALHDEIVESGMTIGRVQGTKWQNSQIDNGDGTYTYNWNYAPEWQMDDLMLNGDILPIVRLDTQTSGAPTETGMTNFYYNTFQNPMGFIDWVREATSRWKGYTPYYIFNNEPGFNFYKDADTHQWNATAINYANSFILFSKMIHEKNPEVKVIHSFTIDIQNPNPDFNIYKSVDALTETGMGNYVDILTMHYYGEHKKFDDVYELTTFVTGYLATSTQFNRYLGGVKSRLAQYGLQDKELWLGETGVGSKTEGTDGFDESVTYQSIEMVKQYLIFGANGFTKIMMIVFKDLNKTACNTISKYWACSGLYTYDGTRKDSFYVHKQLTSLLKGAYFVSTSTQDTVLGYRFASSTADIYAAYSDRDNVGGVNYTWDTTLDRDYTSGEIIDAVLLTKETIDPTSLQTGDIISTDVSTTTIKYLYLQK